MYTLNVIPLNNLGVIIHNRVGKMGFSRKQKSDLFSLWRKNCMPLSSFNCFTLLLFYPFTHSRVTNMDFILTDWAFAHSVKLIVSKLMLLLLTEIPSVSTCDIYLSFSPFVLRRCCSCVCFYTFFDFEWHHFLGKTPYP